MRAAASGPWVMAVPSLSPGAGAAAWPGVLQGAGGREQPHGEGSVVWCGSPCSHKWG